MTTKESIMNTRLTKFKASQELAALYLANGVKLVGKVEDFDDESIHLSSDIDGGVTIERRNFSAVQKNFVRKGEPENRNR